MPTVVSSGTIGYTAAGVTTTPAFSVVAGQKVVVFCTWQTSAADPVISGGAVAASLTVQSGSIVSGGSWSKAWVIDIASTNASYTISATKADGYTSIFWIVVDGPFGTTASTELALDASPFSHSITTTLVDALILAYVSPEAQSNITSIDATPTGFTELQEILSFDFWLGASAHRQAATVGTYTFTPAVVGGGAVTSALILVALYPAGAPPVGDPVPGFLMIYESGQWQEYIGTVRQGSSWTSNLKKGYVP